MSLDAPTRITLLSSRVASNEAATNGMLMCTGKKITLKFTKYLLHKGI